MVSLTNMFSNCVKSKNTKRNFHPGLHKNPIMVEGPKNWPGHYAPVCSLLAMFLYWPVTIALAYVHSWA
jgi:hypothetical protein